MRKESLRTSGTERPLRVEKKETFEVSPPLSGRKRRICDTADRRLHHTVKRGEGEHVGWARKKKKDVSEVRYFIREKGKKAAITPPTILEKKGAMKSRANDWGMVSAMGKKKIEVVIEKLCGGDERVCPTGIESKKKKRMSAGESAPPYRAKGGRDSATAGKTAYPF